MDLVDLPLEEEAEVKEVIKNYFNQKTEKSRKSLTDYTYKIGSAKEAGNYTIITKYLINHIKKTYTNGDDIVDALEDKQEKDFSIKQPELKISDNANATAKERENRQFELLYAAEIKSHLARVDQYCSNKGNAYVLLFERCNKAMQNKIQSRKDFSTMIKNNPIELLKAIKEQLIKFQENKYEMRVIADALQNIISAKQREDESLIDYTQRYKSAKDVLIAQIGGPIILTKVVEGLEEYDANDATKIKEQQKTAFEKIVTLIYLENSDRMKYGSLIKGLLGQYTLGQDQYPKDIISATNIVSNHCFDETYNEARKKRREKDKTSTTQDNNQPEQNFDLSFAQMEGRFYCCGKKGHKSPQCRDRDKPKSEWAINQTPELRNVQHVMSGTQTSQDDDAVSQVPSVQPSTSPPSLQQSATMPSAQTSTSPFGWMSLQFSAMQTTADMREIILLDNQSTVDLFCNPKLVKDIVSMDETLNLQTNAGNLITNKRATVPDYGQVWFDENAITNVFSLANMANKYKVTFDSENGNAFIMHMPKR